MKMIKPAQHCPMACFRSTDNDDNDNGNDNGNADEDEKLPECCPECCLRPTGKPAAANHQFFGLQHHSTSCQHHHLNLFYTIAHTLSISFCEPKIGGLRPRPLIFGGQDNKSPMHSGRRKFIFIKAACP